MTKKNQVKDVVASKTPKLPTIAEFFVDMAAKQGEEIVRLKSDAADSGEVPAKPESGAMIAPYPWQLHPLRKSAAPRKPSVKKPAAKKKTTKASKGNRKKKGLDPFPP